MEPMGKATFKGSQRFFFSIDLVADPVRDPVRSSKCSVKAPNYLPIVTS